MAGEIEAAGELVSGALLGRAVEPNAGEGGGEGGVCLNCGTALIGPHCHRCGQAAHVHRTLSGMAHELVHGVFHFEGKLWRTLPLLAWRPGELTRRYIEGERARFVSPIAIFLFSIFAMFAVFSAVGISTPAEISANPEQAISAARTGLIARQREAAEALKTLPAGHPKRAKFEQRAAEAAEDLKALDAALPKKGGTHITIGARRTGIAALDHGIEKWQKNPALMLYKLQSSIYKFSWLLIPLSVPFLWLLFCWKRRYRLYDHTVFITYSIAFMSLLFIAVTLAGTAGISENILLPAAFLLPFVHLLRQMKQAYQLSWISALLRPMVLSFFIGIVLVIFLSLLIVLGLLG